MRMPPAASEAPPGRGTRGPDRRVPADGGEDGGHQGSLMSETRKRSFPYLARLAGLLLGAVVLFASAARPQAQPGAEGLARYLPADTLLLFSLPDLSSTLQDCRSLPLWEMAREKEISEFLAAPFRQMH